MISYIVSVFDRMRMLRACLASLRAGDCSAEILVCCNDTLEETVNRCDSVCEDFRASIFETGFNAQTCYESANLVGPNARGDWLCFPSDDSLYVQDFARIMLKTAVDERADLVYCDCLYAVGSEKSQWKQYSVLDTQPTLGRIDKTCFIVKRELFHGFPPHPQDYRDGALIEQLVRDGVRHAKAPGVLCVHQ